MRARGPGIHSGQVHKMRAWGGFALAASQPLWGQRLAPVLQAVWRERDQDVQPPRPRPPCLARGPCPSLPQSCPHHSSSQPESEEPQGEGHCYPLLAAEETVRSEVLSDLRKVTLHEQWRREWNPEPLTSGRCTPDPQVQWGIQSSEHPALKPPVSSKCACPAPSSVSPRVHSNPSRLPTRTARRACYIDQALCPALGTQRRTKPMRSLPQGARAPGREDSDGREDSRTQIMAVG